MDRDWNEIVGNGGHASMCDRCENQWKLSWQNPNLAVAKRAFETMMQMIIIDRATIEAVQRG